MRDLVNVSGWKLVLTRTLVRSYLVVFATIQGTAQAASAPIAQPPQSEQSTLESDLT